MRKKLIEIDEFLLDDHYYLTYEDQCFYLRTYTSHQTYSYSSTNQLMSNFKKGMDRQGSAEWKYKLQAIHTFAENLTSVFKAYGEWKDFVFIPIPSSKHADDPYYDPRLIQVLHLVQEQIDIKISEAIYTKETREPLHKSESRLSPVQLKSTMAINYKLIPDDKVVILFDDMITSGTHFTACKELIKEEKPNIEIIGIFLCRRNFDQSNNQQ